MNSVKHWCWILLISLSGCHYSVTIPEVVSAQTAIQEELIGQLTAGCIGPECLDFNVHMKARALEIEKITECYVKRFEHTVFSCLITFRAFPFYPAINTQVWRIDFDGKLSPVLTAQLPDKLIGYFRG